MCQHYRIVSAGADKNPIFHIASICYTYNNVTEHTHVHLCTLWASPANIIDMDFFRAIQTLPTLAVDVQICNEIYGAVNSKYCTLAVER